MFTMFSVLPFTILGLLNQFASAQDLLRDPGVAGPSLEIVHLYHDQWPTGIAVSSTGRKFSNYPPGLDSNNTNNGSNGKYTVAELFSDNTERPYPSVEINKPPQGAINYTQYPPVGSNYQNHLIGVQSVVIDSRDRLWILDTGRALTEDGILATASYGGPKLIGVDLVTDTIIKTIVFPVDIAYPDSYLNDVRFDLRKQTTSSSEGVAYITDSSSEGRNGIIIVDLGTGESWRHLNRVTSTQPQGQFLAYIWGMPTYYIPGKGLPPTYLPIGSDGIALSADGEDLYYGAVASRYLYSVPTKRLLQRDETSEILAQAAVVNHGEKGVSDGYETDSNGLIYFGNMEQNAISAFNPTNGTSIVFVRDPRINWVDTFSIATDGYLYFTNNQLSFSKSFYPGVDRRTLPYALFRVKLPNGGTKASLV